MVAKQELQYGLGDPVMLEKIDKLFACKVGELVDLPQIIAVGDQSSGKSSVIEGLIDKPLPRDSGLCTRFATQFIFRRGPDELTSFSIIPGPEADDEHRARVSQWSRDGTIDLKSSAFLDIMNEVHDVMGISRGQQEPISGLPTFSQDVLRIEITGKTQEHLSVIDVPGIFKNTSKGLTTKADITLVRNLVLGFMENPRCIMLTIIPANVDVATQEILELASDVDPEGRRTLGILTKPDLVDRGAESRVTDLIEGKNRPMRLGWHLVRSPGQQELSDPLVSRHSIEKDEFSKAHWRGIAKDKVGIKSLRKRLQEVLCEHVRHEFPKVKQEINRKLVTLRKDLENLGAERETPEKQSSYLISLATNFQKVVAHALEKRYGSSDFFDEPALRLTTAVATRDEEFSSEIHKWGQEFAFVSSTSSELGDSLIPPPLSWEEVEQDTEEPELQFEIRKYEDPADISDILHEQRSLVQSHTRPIAIWLKQIYDMSKGFELGTIDAAMLRTTMKKQTAKWPDIALGYISDIVTVIHDFITKLLKSLCPDGKVHRELLALLLEDLMKWYQKAIDQVKFFLTVERTGTPITLDHSFNEKLEKCRQARLQIQMADMAISDCKHGTVVRLKDMTYAYSISNTQHTVQDIHDILFSYYKIVQQRFVDNVCKYAADHFLLNGSETPLTLFSPTFVNALTAEQLETIAGEDLSTRRQRKQLKLQFDSLHEARKILT